MAQVIITIRIMPESPDTDLAKIEEEATQLISKFGGSVGKSEKIPVAFGLKAVDLTFVSDEDKGSPDDLEIEIANLENVASATVTNVTRALG